MDGVKSKTKKTNTVKNNWLIENTYEYIEISWDIMEYHHPICE